MSLLDGDFNQMLKLRLGGRDAPSHFRDLFYNNVPRCIAVADRVRGKGEPRR